MNEFQTIITKIWRNTWLCWAAADNKRRIAAGRLADARDEFDALPPGPLKDAKGGERLNWNDLLVRCRWAAKFLQTAMKPQIAKTFELAGGNTDTLPAWTGLRLRTPISFTEAPPAEVTALEASFSPDDQEMRLKTVPYSDQMNKLYQAIITDSYKAGGMGITLDQRVQELRLLPEYASYMEAFDHWDTFIGQGLAYLVWGRGCFGDAETTLENGLNAYQGQLAEKTYQQLSLKYSTTENSAIKAVGGLYAINVELLPAEWAAKVEPDPLEFRG